MRELINASSVKVEFFSLLFCLFVCIKLALQLETSSFLLNVGVESGCFKSLGSLFQQVVPEKN